MKVRRRLRLSQQALCLRCRYGTGPHPSAELLSSRALSSAHKRRRARCLNPPTMKTRVTWSSRALTGCTPSQSVPYAHHVFSPRSGAPVDLGQPDPTANLRTSLPATRPDWPGGHGSETIPTGRDGQCYLRTLEARGLLTVRHQSAGHLSAQPRQRQQFRANVGHALRLAFKRTSTDEHIFKLATAFTHPTDRDFRAFRTGKDAMQANRNRYLESRLRRHLEVETADSSPWKRFTPWPSAPMRSERS